jgi:hypothetical protein
MRVAMRLAATSYKGLVIGLTVGVMVSIVLLAYRTQQVHDCEPVVDVEYTRKGTKFAAHTVVRQPVRDGKRCLLAEVGS